MVRLLIFTLIVACSIQSNYCELTDLSLQTDISNNDFGSNPLVLITCSGKSGGTSLYGAFKNLNFETEKVHSMDESLYSYVELRAKNDPVVFLESIRFILPRKISSYFQNIERLLAMTAEEILFNYEKNPTDFLNFLFQDFRQKLLIFSQYYSFKSWERLGYNCLDDEFDFEKKCQFKKFGNLYFLILRFEEIQEWESIIKSTGLPLDLSNFKMVRSNISADKWYSEIYRDFLKYFTISQEDFDAVLNLNARETAHFFTETEVQKSIEKWKPYIR